jgi:hypothetical protein
MATWTGVDGNVIEYEAIGGGVFCVLNGVTRSESTLVNPVPCQKTRGLTAVNDCH